MSGEEDVVVLGGQLAAAMEAERRHEPAGPSPIAHIHYPAGAADLWRWTECAADGEMSAFVAGYAAAGEAARTRIRASLTMDDLYTLLLYAQRRALAAIRASDPEAVGSAFDALSTVDIERVDWRDVAVAAMLVTFAAGRTGAAASEAAAGAIGRAEPRVAEMLARTAGQGAANLSSAGGYRLVETPDGPVLFQDGRKRYAPARDLVPLALGLAAAIDADDTYEVDGVSVAEGIVPIWVGEDPAVAAALDGVTGCVSVHAGVVGRRPGHFLLAYVAEAATAEDAATIATAANRRQLPAAVIAGVADDRLCAVLIGRSAVAGEEPVETPERMARFRPAVSALLRGSGASETSEPGR